MSELCKGRWYRVCVMTVAWVCCANTGVAADETALPEALAQAPANT
jgi:hypothetical protein